MSRWELVSRDVETGQDIYDYNGQFAPTIKAHNLIYNVGEYYALGNKILWLRAERMSGDPPIHIKAQFTPDEVQYCSDPELSQLLQNSQSVKEAHDDKG